MVVFLLIGIGLINAPKHGLVESQYPCMFRRPSLDWFRNLNESPNVPPGCERLFSADLVTHNVDIVLWDFSMPNGGTG